MVKDEALGEKDHDLAATPWEEVRDYFHYCDNYVDAVDRAAEHFATTSGFVGADKLGPGVAWLEDRHNVSVSVTSGPLRHFDPSARRVPHSDHLLQHIDSAAIQLELAFDYQSNLPLYPEWQAYFREYEPPMLITWGRHDQIFPVEGAIAYLEDVPQAEVHLLDTGHFALEEDGALIADLIDRFMETKAEFGD